MKKLMFVRPPFEGIGDYRPVHLGIAMLSSYVKKNFGAFFDYYFVDALLDGIGVDETLKKIVAVKPDFIGLTVKSVQVEQTLELIKKIKEKYTPIIVCGGNHVSIEPDIFIKNGADFAIIGEGEEAIVKIIKYVYFEGEDVDKFSNIITPKNNSRKDRKIIVTDCIDNYGMPDWSIMDLKRYNENIHLNTAIPALPVMASRGCPYMCDFCSSHLTWGTKVRYRSPRLVLDEIRNNIEVYGIDNIHFYDDNLMLNNKWLTEFLDLVEKEQIRFKWICLSRPEIIIKNSYLLKKMKECGCQGFELGFETSDEELYDNMNKKNTKSGFSEVFQLVLDNDFPMIELLLMCFYDGETFSSLFKTYEQLKKYKKRNVVQISSRYFATPFHNTEFHHNIDQKGILLSGGYKYKYAIFLNFMPFSFLNSTFENYKINSKMLKLQFQFEKIENIIHKQEFEYIQSKVSMDNFADIFNQLADKKETILYLSEVVKKQVEGNVSKEAIYEYVGRMIEFAISRGGINNL